MKNLTVIYYTCNKIPEYFMKNVQDQLKKVVGDTPIISVSWKPIDFGQNICVGELEQSAYTIYKQVLIGAKAATTEYIATAEDDVLYPREHFEYRPQGEVFAYDLNKWSIFTWTRPPIFSYRERVNMTGLIVNREALIRTLEERFKKFPDPTKVNFAWWGEPGRFENHLRLTGLTKERVRASVPHIMFSTREAISFKHLGTRKAHSDERATELPFWGKASDVLRLYDKDYNN